MKILVEQAYFHAKQQSLYSSKRPPSKDVHKKRNKYIRKDIVDILISSEIGQTAIDY